MAAGDSLLEAGKDITILKVDLFSDPAHTQKFAEIIYRTNDAHRLSVAEIQVQAPSFEEAERRAHLVVLPIISWWSLRYDIAIDISGYEVLEAATEVRRWVFNIEGGFRKFILDKADMQIQSDPHLRPIFSVYREGLNATHPFYQCLSFYKVTQAIKRLRAERRAAAKAAGKPIDEPPEKIPDTEESLPFSQKSIRRNFQPYLVRKYSWVLDQLRPRIRNALAHLDPFRKSLVADSFDDVLQCEKALPALRFIAREMIQNELGARFGQHPGN